MSTNKPSIGSVVDELALQNLKKQCQISYIYTKTQANMVSINNEYTVVIC